MNKTGTTKTRVSSAQIGLFFASLLFLQTIAIEPAHAQSCMNADNTAPDICQAVIPSSEVAFPPTASASCTPGTQCSDGIRVDHGVTDVLFDSAGYPCVFVLSNTSNNDYFVPQGSVAEFLDFVHNVPPGVMVASCVPPIIYTATSTIPNVVFEIFAEGGLITPVGVGIIAPITPIAVPTTQSTTNGIVPAPNTTTVRVISQSNPQPIQFYYTRKDCANDPYLNPPLCNTWIVRETQTIQFTAPQTTIGTDSLWGNPVVTSVYDISSSVNGPWTPITVDGIPGGTPGIYNNDYMPPTLLSCSYGGTTYLDGQTWSVAGTQSPTTAECPYGTGTRTDDVTTPYICNDGVASTNGTTTQTGFSGTCPTTPTIGQGEITYYQLTPMQNPAGYVGMAFDVDLMTPQDVYGDPTFFTTTEPYISTTQYNTGLSVPGAQPINQFFGVCYDAGLQITTPGAYTFVAQADDGVAVWIDGNFIFDVEAGSVSTTGELLNLGNGLPSSLVNVPPVNLSSGVHDIEIKYLQGWGGYYGLQMWLLPPGQSTTQWNPQCAVDYGTCPEPSSAYAVQLVGPPEGETNCPGAAPIPASGTGP